MKNTTLLILFIISNLAFPQSDSLKELLKYYPLHIGDYWEYQVSQTGSGPNENKNWIEYKKVVGDTILLNNKKYFIVKSDTNSNYGMFTNIIRIDSINGNVYQYDYNMSEILIDSLFMNVGDTLSLQCFRLSDQYMKEVFGQNCETRYYKVSCVTSESIYFDYERSKYFGEIHKNYSSSYVTPIFREHILTYAKINNVEYGIKTGIDNKSNSEDRFILNQNFPNPFNPTTKISYTIPTSMKGEKVKVQLIIYDILGRKVKTLIDKIQNDGSYEVEFNATLLPSGVYFYKLQTGNNIITKKMILLK